VFGHVVDEYQHSEVCVQVYLKMISHSIWLWSWQSLLKRP